MKRFAVWILAGSSLFAQSKWIVENPPARDIPTEMVNFHALRFVAAQEKLNKTIDELNQTTNAWNILIRQENSILDIKNSGGIHVEKLKLKAHYNKLAKEFMNRLDAVHTSGREFAKSLAALPPKVN